MGPFVPCPVCSSATARTFPARYGMVSQCRAPECGHLFLTERPAVAVGDALRGLDELLAHHANRNRRLVAWLHHEAMLGPGKRVLVYGPAGGELAVAVRETFRTATVSCVEPDRALQFHLRGLGLDVFDDLDDVPVDHDTLLLVDVLDTLENPVGLLAQLTKRMHQGGRAFIATPLGETRRGDHTTSAYESPTRIQFFTERSLDHAVRLAGLSAFTFRVVNPLYHRHRGLKGEALDAVVAATRIARARLFGPRHLTGYATRTA